MSSVVSRSAAAVSAPTVATTASYDTFSSCSPSSALVAGVKIGSSHPGPPPPPAPRDLGRYVGGQDVVRYAEHLEPPQAHRGEHLALVRDRCLQDPVERALPVAGDHQQITG